MDNGTMESGWWGYLLTIVPLFNNEILKFHVPYVMLKLQIQK